jgi:hypothetical protein
MRFIQPLVVDLVHRDSLDSVGVNRVVDTVDLVFRNTPRALDLCRKTLRHGDYGVRRSICPRRKVLEPLPVLHVYPLALVVVMHGYHESRFWYDESNRGSGKSVEMGQRRIYDVRAVPT